MYDLLGLVACHFLSKHTIEDISERPKGKNKIKGQTQFGVEIVPENN
jgi:hypothetical protein